MAVYLWRNVRRCARSFCLPQDRPSMFHTLQSLPYRQCPVPAELLSTALRSDRNEHPDRLLLLFQEVAYQRDRRVVLGFGCKLNNLTFPSDQSLVRIKKKINSFLGTAYDTSFLDLRCLQISTVTALRRTATSSTFSAASL